MGRVRNCANQVLLRVGVRVAPGQEPVLRLVHDQEIITRRSCPNSLLFPPYIEGVKLGLRIIPRKAIRLSQGRDKHPLWFPAVIEHKAVVPLSRARVIPIVRGVIIGDRFNLMDLHVVADRGRSLDVEPVNRSLVPAVCPSLPICDLVEIQHSGLCKTGVTALGSVHERRGRRKRTAVPVISSHGGGSRVLEFLCHENLDLSRFGEEPKEYCSPTLKLRDVHYRDIGIISYLKGEILKGTVPRFLVNGIVGIEPVPAVPIHS